ncbi:MAG: hypothetical protein V2B19_06120 [Pseudomonadota bacterium]
MISHHEKAQYFREVQRIESSNQIDHPVFFDILKRKSVQFGSEHDMYTALWSGMIIRVSVPYSFKVTINGLKRPIK